MIRQCALATVPRLALLVSATSGADGAPVGTTGEARAYACGNGITVVLVIGNPVPPEQAQRAAGYHCAGGSSGVSERLARLSIGDVGTSRPKGTT